MRIYILSSCISKSYNYRIHINQAVDVNLQKKEENISRIMTNLSIAPISKEKNSHRLSYVPSMLMYGMIMI